MPIMDSFPSDLPGSIANPLYTVNSNSLSNYSYVINDNGILMPKLEDYKNQKSDISCTITCSDGESMTIKSDEYNCEDDYYGHQLFDRDDSTHFNFGRNAYVAGRWFQLEFSRAIRINKVHINMRSYDNNFTIYFKASNDASSWATLATYTLSDGQVINVDKTFTNTNFYKYFRIDVPVSTDHVLYMYTLNILDWDYNVTRKKNALTCSALDVNMLHAGKVISIKTNSYDITSVNSNTLNGKVITDILKPSSIYHLVYDGTQFIPINNYETIQICNIRENSSRYFDKPPKYAFGTLHEADKVVLNDSTIVAKYIYPPAMYPFKINGNFVVNEHDIDADYVVVVS